MPNPPAKPQPKPAVNVAKPINRVAVPTFAPATKKPATPPKATTPVAARPVTLGRPVTVSHTGTATAPAKAAPVLTTVPVSRLQVTPQVNNIRYLNPDFARNIINLRPAVTGVPRDQIKAPICPIADATDEVLYEDPAQPSKKFYLPRYQLATDNQRYQVAFRQTESGWSFAVQLTKFAAPSIASAAGSAQELDHRVAVLVRFSQMIGNQAGAQEELAFQEVSLKGGVLQATLRLNSLQQRDLLYQALRDRTFGAALLVRRAITVAVPVQAPVPQIPLVSLRMMPGIPRPQPAPPKPATPLYRQAERVVEQVVDPKPFVFSPDLHPYIFSGVTPASSGGRMGLTRYQVPWSDGRSHTYYQDIARPYLFYYLPDCFKIARRPDGAHEPLMSVSFGQAASVDDLKATFSFIAVPYVDSKRLQDASGKLRSHIGDSLPKGVTGPQFEPLLSAPEKTHFSLSYPGCDTSKGPFELRDKAAVDLRGGIHDSLTLPLPKFQSLYDALFSPSSLILTGKVDVDLGSDSGEEIPFAARLNDLAGDFLAYSHQPLAATAPATSTSPSTDGPGAPSLTESVTDAIGDAIGGDVKSAVTDIVGGLAGKFLNRGKKDKDKKKKTAPVQPSVPLEPGLQATFQNIIESPIEIQSVGATLVRGPQRLQAVVDGLDFSQPVQIGPGEQITFNVVPAKPVRAGQPMRAEYDLSGAHPVPDREAIWKEILDPNTVESYLTSVIVKTPASTFAVPKNGDASQQIVSLVVDFDAGVSAELNAGKLEVKVDLPHPVVNYVLRKADPGEYRYKRTIVLANGEQNRDRDWRPPETTTVLYPAVR